MMKMHAALLLVGCLLLQAFHYADANAATIVPPGNRNAKQPAIPGGSIKRTRGTTFEKKYQKIRNLLANDRKLMGKIKSAAKTHEIGRAHV